MPLRPGGIAGFDRPDAAAGERRPSVPFRAMSQAFLPDYALSTCRLAADRGRRPVALPAFWTVKRARRSRRRVSLGWHAEPEREPTCALRRLVRASRHRAATERWRRSVAQREIDEEQLAMAATARISAGKGWMGR